MARINFERKAISRGHLELIAECNCKIRYYSPKYNLIIPIFSFLHFNKPHMYIRIGRTEVYADTKTSNLIIDALNQKNNGYMPVNAPRIINCKSIGLKNLVSCYVYEKNS